MILKDLININRSDNTNRPNGVARNITRSISSRDRPHNRDFSHNVISLNIYNVIDIMIRHIIITDLLHIEKLLTMPI